METKIENKSSENMALSAYAEAWNKLDSSIVAPFLKEDFHYSSIYVFDEIKSKEEYLYYLMGKFKAIKTTGSKVVADVIPGRQLIKLIQDESRVAVLDVRLDEGLIARADMMLPDFYNL